MIFIIVISIHAPRGGSDRCLGCHIDYSRISIHAPRGGSDDNGGNILLDSGISIHAPRGGSDVRLYVYAVVYTYFNPRSPWGERLVLPDLPGNIRDFNPRSPWGERRLLLAMAERFGYFNPRSPWGERLSRSTVLATPVEFQSTLPVGGATCNNGCGC